MVPCHKCGVEISERDRFCPYCHAPAPGTRLQPAFAPSERITAVLDELDAADAAATEAGDGVRCPRCERFTAADSAFCSNCGMAIEDPAVRAGWEPPDPGTEWPAGWGSELPIWPGEHLEDVPAFIDTDTVSVAARAAIGLLGAVALMGVAASISWQQSLASAGRGIGADNRVAGSESWLRLLDRIGLLLLLVVVVLVAIWAGRAYHNLPALGARGLRWRPRDVQMGWVVPGLNLVRPLGIMADLWRSSDPDRHLHPSTSWRQDPVPTWLQLWWAFAAATPFLLAGVSALGDPSSVPIDREDAIGLLRILVHGIELTAAIASFVLIGEITARQSRRARAIGWPALSGYRIPPPGKRVVALEDVGPVEIELRRKAKVHSSEVAGKY
jgi:hypothetical protein